MQRFPALAALVPALALLAPPAARAVTADAEQADTVAGAILEALRDEHSVRAVKLLDPALRPALTPTRLSAAWRRLVGALGPLRSWQADPAPSADGRRGYLLDFDQGRARALLGFGPAGTVTGLWFAPEPPGSRQARGIELAVGEAPLLCGATLALPGGGGRHPAALLLGPLGALDRDASAGGRKPLRDLADELASRGVASLRFDRRTVAWPAGNDPRLDLEREVAADAVQALVALRARPEVDPDRVFVVGLGVGGTLAPEVAARVPRSAGAVVVGSPPQGWPLALVAQARAQGAPGSAEVLQVERDADRALHGRLGDDTFLGYAGAWWTDLSARDPVAGAARLGRPVLFLRGDQDTLVREADLAAIRRQTARLKLVELETLPGVDGLLFAPGQERLDPAAARRIADFIAKAPPAPPEK